MGDLKLGVQSLPAAEAGLVRALLQLMAHGRAGVAPRWTFADQGPFDALVTDAATQPSSLPARAVLRLAQAGAQVAEADVVARPLRADALERWLDAVATRLASAPAAARTTVRSDDPRWKLRRWPPNELLRADAGRTRLATMLSRRALSVDELAQLAGVAPEKCRTFVQLLQSFELLVADAPPPEAPRALPAPPPAATTAAAPAAPAPAPAASRWSLVASIRRKLGLGGAG